MKLSKTFVGVEIARTGSFQASTGPIVLTPTDFDNAQRAYLSIGGTNRAMVKLGHDEKQKLLQSDGLPNAGFLENIRREGDRLVADLVDVPDTVAELVQAGRFNSRSIEALRNVMIAGKRWPFVITGLALLGADLPAVDSLKSMAALYAARGFDVPETEDPEAEVVMLLSHFDGNGTADADQVIQQLHDLLAKAETIVHKKGGAPKFRTLVRSAVDELRAISKKTTTIKNSREDGNMDTKALAKKLGLAEDASEEDITKALDALKTKAEAKTEKTKAEADVEAGIVVPKADFDKLQSELVEARKDIVKLQSNAATDEATKQVDAALKAGKFAPASRTTLIKMASGSPTEFGELVKATPDNAILAKQGEKGHDGGGSADDITITAEEERIAAQTGLTKEELLEQKYHDAGKPLPEEVVTALKAQRAKK